MSHMNHTAARKLYLVSYDITSNKLRRKIEKALKNFGQRMQKSVFLCTLAPGQLKSMEDTLLLLLTHWSALQESTDSVIVTGPIERKNIKYLLGNPCLLEDFVIY